MSLFKLSFSNFKRSVRNYGMLIVSLAFSVFIFFNFQNVLYSDSMDVLMDYKKDYIEAIPVVKANQKRSSFTQRKAANAI